MSLSHAAPADLLLVADEIEQGQHRETSRAVKWLRAAAATIQALFDKVMGLEARVDELEQALAMQKALVADVRQRVHRMEWDEDRLKRLKKYGRRER